VLGRYRQVFAWTSVYQMMRLAFDDVNHVEGKDWFRPFVAAMCAWQEHQYRGLLGMPSALGGDSDKEAVKYSLFAEFVLEGARFPDLAWHDQAEDVYEAMLDESKSRILNSVSENRLKD
ncbi:MAG TPA: hypothetical protein VJR03_09690, partial [Nitrospira sp.]|nr:hypothetical protein [Nitrospira sp.]